MKYIVTSICKIIFINFKTTYIPLKWRKYIQISLHRTEAGRQARPPTPFPIHRTNGSRGSSLLVLPQWQSRSPPRRQPPRAFWLLVHAPSPTKSPKPHRAWPALTTSITPTLSHGRRSPRHGVPFPDLPILLQLPRPNPPPPPAPPSQHPAAPPLPAHPAAPPPYAPPRPAPPPSSPGLLLWQRQRRRRRRQR